MRKNQLGQFIFLIGIISSCLFISSVSVQADETKEDMDSAKKKDRRQKKIAEVYEQIGITPEQKKQLQDHREQNHSQMEALFEQIKTKKDQMREELQKPEFDINKVKQIHEELKALKAKGEDDRLEGILEVRKILTPEQFTKFMTLMEKHKRGPRSSKEK